MATHPPVYPPCPRWRKGQPQREELQRSDQTLRSRSKARISETHQSVPRMPRLSKTYQCAKNAQNMKNLPVCQECQEYEKLTSVPRCQAVRAMGHEANKGGHKDARDGGQHVGHGHQGTWDGCFWCSHFWPIPAKFGARSAWLENTPENMLKIQADLKEEQKTSSDNLQVSWSWLISVSQHSHEVPSDE